MIRLTLPYPPATNNLYRNLEITKNGKKMVIRVHTGDAKKFKKAVEKICQATAMQTILGDVGIVFRAYRPRRAGDLDGMFKAVFDALKGLAYIDDKQISKIEAERFEDKNNPRVEIEIYPRSLL